MDRQLLAFVESTGAAATAIEEALDRARPLAAEILTLSINLPDAQREDLMGEARRLSDNLSREIGLYTWFSDWLRALKPWVEREEDPELIAQWRTLWVRVMGD